MSNNTEPTRFELHARQLELNAMSPKARVAWAYERLPGAHVLSSSFGVQAAVMLHLVTRVQPSTPVVVIDTGYLFPETYRFIDALTDRLQLNLQVYRAGLSAAWQEARHGCLWQDGVDGLVRYNRINKVQPMRRALADFKAGTWLSGLRRDQSPSRTALPLLDWRWGCYKLHPIADWSDRDVWRYLKRHDLPFHPLWHEGYISVGDVHSTRRMEPGMAAEDTRFSGLRRECGLHMDA